MTILLVGQLLTACGRTPEPVAEPIAEPGASDLTLVGTDVGDPGAQGFFEPNVGLRTVSGDRVRMAGAGADISGRKDAFFYGYVEVSGDVTLEARLTSIEAHRDDAMAGVMIRSSLHEDASNVLMAMTAAERVVFQVRNDNGAETSPTVDEAAGGTPLWLRIVREGAVVSTYSSLDGASYRQHSTSELELPSSFYVGLAVTSHSAGRLSKADFDMLWIDSDRALPPAVVESDPETEPDTQPETEPETELETEPDTPPETDPETDPEPVPDNGVPMAVADTYTLANGDVLEVSAAAGVLANDSDPDGDVLTASIVEAPQSGEIQMDADGSFTFTPAAGFAGRVDVVYEAADSHGATATARVAIHVSDAIDEVDGDIFVAPHGSDDASGSFTDPFETIQRAVDVAVPGDTILMRGGVYYLADPVRLTDGGNENARIVLASYPGERAIIDGSRMVQAKPIIKVTSSYWHFRDFELRNGRYFGMLLEHATHNLIERIESHHNAHTGFHLWAGASFNTIVDSDSHHNYDPASGGENADGFAIKNETAYDNLLLRTRAWNNSDDGFDLLDSPPQRIDQSVAYRNGLQDDGTPYPNGNGNGFKLGIGEGRYVSGGGHYVTRSVAWENEVWGFNSNNGTVPITLHNNTGWNNGWYDFFFNKGEHVLVNNLASGGKNWTSEEVVSHTNSWTLGLSDPQFSSTVPTSPDFLLLSAGSDAIDAGQALGLPFDGSAPDLGAYEVGADPTVVIGIHDSEWTEASALLAPR